MKITLKTTILGAVLATGAAAVDIQYCHGGTKGVCLNITFATSSTTCYPLSQVNGTIDTLVGITTGVKYTMFTGAGCTGNASAVFGAGTNTLVAPFLNKVLSISAGIPNVFTPLGCFTDNAGSRTLAAASFANSTMTVENCVAFCTAGGFNYAGVEFGDECYCDWSIQFPAVLATDPTTCNVPCIGNANETCGGASRINVLSNGKPNPTIPAAIVGPGAKTWTYKNCTTDNSLNALNRTLPLRLATSGVTPQTCVNTCAAANQTIAGVEFGIECWCGTALNVNATKVPDVQCSKACDADPTFFCGGNNLLNIWSFP